MADQDSNHVIITRKEARERGLKRYFTGKPCKQGHIAERYTDTCGCLACSTMYAARWTADHIDHVNDLRRSSYKARKIESGQISDRFSARIERDDAISRGLKHYFTGKPCKNGHIDKRFVVNNHCFACAYLEGIEARKRPEVKARMISHANAQKKKPKYVEWRKKYQKNRRSTDLQFKLRHDLGARLKIALRKAVNGKYEKIGSAVRDLGCSIEYFMTHLERQFQPGMTWKNMGKKWHVDHVRPLSSFDLTERAQLLEACNYKNLRPLWVKDNLAKGDKDPIDFARSKGLLL